MDRRRGYEHRLRACSRTNLPFSPPRFLRLRVYEVGVQQGALYLHRYPTSSTPTAPSRASYSRPKNFKTCGFASEANISPYYNGRSILAAQKTELHLPAIPRAFSAIRSIVIRRDYGITSSPRCQTTGGKRKPLERDERPSEHTRYCRGISNIGDSYVKRH